MHRVLGRVFYFSSAGGLSAVSNIIEGEDCATTTMESDTDSMLPRRRRFGLRACAWVWVALALVVSVVPAARQVGRAQPAETRSHSQVAETRPHSWRRVEPALRSSGQTVLYVDARGAGGSDWTDVYTNLQDALDRAAQLADQGPVEIWVAAGVYKPDQGASVTAGERTASFNLINNVALYGGFGGWETQRDQRDPATNETILSGDLARNDEFDVPVESTCCSATWEPGCDDEACEALVLEEDAYCATHWHPGCLALAKILCCDLCRPTRCENSYQVLRTVGTDATVVLDGFTITAGEANNLDCWDPVLYWGAGLYAEHASPTVNNCTFVENAAVTGMGMFSIHGEPTITNCTFASNELYSTGSALDNRYNEATITNCAFIGNRARGLCTAGSRPVTGCTFIGNAAGGMHHSDGAADIIDCMFIGNSSRYGGAFTNAWTARLINCGFYGNSAGVSGGAVINAGSITLINCVLTGNTAGGEALAPGEPPHPGFAGAFLNDLGHATLINCTLAGNSAGSVGGMWGGHGMTITHSILWGNTDNSGSEFHAQLAANSATTSLSYNCIQGWDPGPGWEPYRNVALDPLFVDPLGADGILGTLDDDLRLSDDSPLINAGDPAFIPDPVASDLGGNPRVQGCRVDLGPYESAVTQAPGDFDSDEDTDLADLAAFQLCIDPGVTNPDWLDTCLCVFDFDDNDTVDLRDFALFQTAFTAGD